MRLANTTEECVRYLDGSLTEHFYVLQHQPDGWYARVRDTHDRRISAHGPFAARGQAIMAAEHRIDLVVQRLSDGAVPVE